MLHLERAVLVSLLPLILSSSTLKAQKHLSVNGSYRATAYDVSGITASGEWTHRHVVAADPDVLPIGTRIKIKHAGRHSGEYVVADTGAKIQGRKLDIYMPSPKECKEFGSRKVRLRVLKFGDGTLETTKKADKQVKKDVKEDVAKGVVGNAATAADWSAKEVAKAKARAESGKTPPQF